MVAILSGLQAKIVADVKGGTRRSSRSRNGTMSTAATGGLSSTARS
jgi:hypothetical protein